MDARAFQNDFLGTINHLADPKNKSSDQGVTWAIPRFPTTTSCCHIYVLVSIIYDNIWHLFPQWPKAHKGVRSASAGQSVALDFSFFRAAPLGAL